MKENFNNFIGKSFFDLNKIAFIFKATHPSSILYHHMLPSPMDPSSDRFNQSLKPMMESEDKKPSRPGKMWVIRNSLVLNWFNCQIKNISYPILTICNNRS